MNVALEGQRREAKLTRRLRSSSQYKRNRSVGALRPSEESMFRRKNDELCSVLLKV